MTIVKLRSHYVNANQHMFILEHIDFGASAAQSPEILSYHYLISADLFHLHATCLQILFNPPI